MLFSCLPVFTRDPCIASPAAGFVCPLQVCPHRPDQEPAGGHSKGKGHPQGKRWLDGDRELLGRVLLCDLWALDLHCVLLIFCFLATLACA